MPLAKMIQPVFTPKYKPLEDDLVQEWLHPQPNAAEPVIIEDVTIEDIDWRRDKELIRLYVIWSRWVGLDDIERSEVIAGACERARGRDYVLRVTSAAGLTPEEAERAGIEYAPLEPAG